MKNIIILSLLLFSILQLKAQVNPNGYKTDKPIIYTRFGISGGNYFGSIMSLNYINNKDIVYELGYSHQYKPSNQRPDDYNSGLLDILTLGSYGKNKYKHVFINVGKSFDLNNKSNIGYERFIIKGGIAFTRVEQLYDFEKQGTMLGANYSFDHRNFNTISLQITPVYEVCKKRFLGISTGLPIVFNKEIFTIGFELAVTIGILRN